MFLREYTQSVADLRGVGPALRGRLERINIHTLSDLLQHFPRDYQDRRRLDLLKAALGKDRINALVRVVEKKWISRGSEKVLKVVVADDSGQASLVCFGRNFLASKLLPGRLFLVSGSFNYRYRELQCSNFDIEAFDPGEMSKKFKRILPLYPLTEGITQALLRRLIGQALNLVRTALAGELPLNLRSRYGLLPKFQALKAIHFPESMEELERARQTLIYEKIFYYHLILQRSRLRRRKFRRQPRVRKVVLKLNLIRRLPYRLTDDQRQVLAEIEADLFSPYPTARLIQGEVGSGKTLVALLTSLSVIEGGEQVAFLAPTELLARQHANNAAGLLAPLGVRIGFLSSNTRARPRNLLKEALLGGEIDILVGTHALFSEDIVYKKLGLVIVDEQQRFGVRQRQAIVMKGDHPDLLLLTATPIPRTLAQTVFGDLELSEIRHKPAGRIPVITHLARQGKETKVYDAVRREVNRGQQAYFVYPLIEESDRLQLKDAESMYQTLKQEVFPEFKLELIHSRLPEDEKERIMGAFVAGKVDILVATSVMEVGMDVPNAGCIVIEHAERFGLSNLHQLRGRVGRGQAQSYAFLIYSRNLTEEGLKRLKVIMTTSDGFKIAEEDLKLRGPGEFLGVRQSGFLSLGPADPIRDQEVFASARKDAAELMRSDPDLLKPENRVFLEILSRDLFGEGEGA